MIRTKVVCSFLPLLMAAASLDAAFPQNLPHLRKANDATQLIVDGRPFLIRGGELGNSTATNPDHLAQFWPRFAELNMNTVLAPVYWHLIEPQEESFNFDTVDRLIEQARENDMRLVLLWFGSWKNSMSCYAPAWVKLDTERFPRAEDAARVRQEILSPFSTENRDADARAYASLLQHLRQTDGSHNTVIMVQVENEIGMIPSARDHSEPANLAFESNVPAALMDYLQANRAALNPELLAHWKSVGGAPQGTWSEVFGSGPAGEEIFMAWHFAQYTDAVAAAGKAEYPLPMFVNAALIRPGYQPGQYPSAGPLPHLIDIWRAGGPNIDFLAPDIYFTNFAEWADRYDVPNNPLFIPEAMRSTLASVNGLYAFGAHEAMGFCPFGIESIGDQAGEYLAASFGLIEQLEPLILKNQGIGALAGFLSAGPEQRKPQQVRLGDYVLNVTFEQGTPPPLPAGMIVPTGHNPTRQIPPSGGLAIAIAPDEFIFAGTSIVVTFSTVSGEKRAGILEVEEGTFESGEWQNVRWLSGDQTHQGRHIRLVPGRFSIQRVKLYSY